MRLQLLGIEIKSWTLTWTKTTWGEAKGVLLPGHVPVLSSDQGWGAAQQTGSFPSQ